MFQIAPGRSASSRNKRQSTDNGSTREHLRPQGPEVGAQGWAQPLASFLCRECRGRPPSAWGDRCPLEVAGCTMAPWTDHSVPGQRGTFPARLPGQDLGYCHPFPRARAQEALSARRESCASFLPERQGQRRAIDASGHLAREPGKVRPGSIQVMGHEDWLPGSGVKGGPAPQGRATGRSAHLLGRCRFQGPGCCSSCSWLWRLRRPPAALSSTWALVLLRRPPPRPPLS